MMQAAIKNFANQFSFTPNIVNADRLVKKDKFILCGMGGSHLAGDILKDVQPDLRLHIHRSYGLPAWNQSELQNSLIIASSYSGNTEEVVLAYDEARKLGLDLVVVAVGGALIDKAHADNIPYIQMPDTGIQPRSALGYSFLSLLKILDQTDLLTQAKELAITLSPMSLELVGQSLARKLKNKIPVIYVSDNNYSVGYNWKIKFNETGKIPAFYNVVPELNHNEMTGFDPVQPDGESISLLVQALSDKFYFVLIKDVADHPRILKRLEILEKLYLARGLSVEVLEMFGTSRMEKIFNSLLLADWTAVHTALIYNLESEQVPMVEEFKKLMK